MIDTILGSFCSFFNWEGAAQLRPRKIPPDKGPTQTADKSAQFNQPHYSLLPRNKNIDPGYMRTFQDSRVFVAKKTGS